MVRFGKWKTRDGRTRTVRLFKAWKNMTSRVRGVNHDGRGNRRWAGLAIEFDSWPNFREWALRNGYSKTHCSLDRIDSTKGYSPSNCRWVTKADNGRYAMQKRWA